MPPRSKREPSVIADDPQTRGAEESETLPVPDIEALREEDAAMLGTDDDWGPPIEVADGISVPTDSTDAIVGDNASVESMLTYKEVSITELFSDGTRGIRLFLGKPTQGTFDVMRARSKGVGVVIEADSASVEYRK